MTRIWRTLSSSSCLMVVMLGAAIFWGGGALVQWWSPAHMAVLQPWLCLLAIGQILLWWVLFTWGRRAGQGLLAALFGLWLLSYLTGTGESWGKWLTVLTRVAGGELLGGLLCFALLARLLDRIVLLWGDHSAPLPSLEGGWSKRWPQHQKSPTHWKAMLKQHFAPATTLPSGLLWAERGRNAALGELWITLGLLLGLVGAGLLLYSPGLLGWTKVVLISLPWIAIGVLLQTGQHYAAVGCWQEDDQLVLWVYSERGLKTTLQALSPLTRALSREALSKPAHKAAKPQKEAVNSEQAEPTQDEADQSAAIDDTMASSVKKKDKQ